MRHFVIEIYWPDMTPALVEGLVARTAAAAANIDAAISYLGCEVAPRDETCFLRVKAADSQTVQEFADGLGLEGARVSELVDVPDPSRAPPPITGWSGTSGGPPRP